MDYIIEMARHVVYDEEFEKVWAMYGNHGTKSVSCISWNRLTDTEKELARENIPIYVSATPDKKYRKMFNTYLNQRVWEDNMETYFSRSKQSNLQKNAQVLETIIKKLNGYE